MSISVDQLESYLDNARNILNKFEEATGLHIKKEETFVQCPINHHHQVPKARLEKHLKICRWRKFGYSKDEALEIVDAETANTSTELAVNADEVVKSIKSGSIPLRTEAMYKSQLNPGQRLRVYEEVIKTSSNAIRNNLPKKALYLDLEEMAKERIKAENDSLTEIEIQKKLRDAKRRRQSYKNRNVHTAKRSQTEIHREVLAIHMEEYKSSLIAQTPNPPSTSTSQYEKYENRDTSSNKTSRHHRHRRSPSKSRKRRRSYSRERERKCHKPEKHKKSGKEKSHKHKTHHH